MNRPVPRGATGHHASCPSRSLPVSCGTSQPAGSAPCAQVSLPCSAPWHPFDLDDRLSCEYGPANPAPRRCREGRIRARTVSNPPCSSGRAAGGGPGSQEGRMIWSALIRTIVGPSRASDVQTSSFRAGNRGPGPLPPAVRPAGTFPAGAAYHGPRRARKSTQSPLESHEIAQSGSFRTALRAKVSRSAADRPIRPMRAVLSPPAPRPARAELGADPRDIEERLSPRPCSSSATTACDGPPVRNELADASIARQGVPLAGLRIVGRRRADFRIRLGRDGGAQSRARASAPLRPNASSSVCCSAVRVSTPSSSLSFCRTSD